MFKKMLTSFFLLQVAALPLPAQTLSLPTTLGEPEITSTAQYLCNGDITLTVEYLEVGENSLAIIHKDGKVRIYVDILSANGAKYASGPFVWWVDGDEADLTNMLEQEAQLRCSQVQSD